MKKYFWKTILLLPLLLATYHFFLKPLYIINFGKTAKGIIVDFDYSQHEGSTTYYAISEYKRKNGKIYTAKISDDKNYDYNKTVELHYLENSEEEAITIEIRNFVPFLFFLFFYFWFFLIAFLNKKFPQNNNDD